MKEGRVTSAYHDTRHAMTLLYSIATAFAFLGYVLIHVGLDVSVRAPHCVCAHVLARTGRRA